MPTSKIIKENQKATGLCFLSHRYHAEWTFHICSFLTLDADSSHLAVNQRLHDPGRGRWGCGGGGKGGVRH